MSRDRALATMLMASALALLPSCQGSEESMESRLTTEECTGLAWSDPTALGLAIAGSPVVARYPSLSVGVAGRVLFGTRIAYFDNARVEDPLTAWAIEAGGELAHPPGGKWFMYPRAVAIPSGVLLVWAEPDESVESVINADWPPGRPVTLLTSEYSTESGWTAADTLWSGGRLRWSDLMGSSPVWSGRSLAIAFFATTADGREQPMFAEKRGGRWDVRPFGVPGRFNGVSLTPIDGDWLAATIATPIEGGTAAMHLHRRIAGETEWSEAQVIAVEADATGTFQVLPQHARSGLVLLVRSGRDAEVVLRVVRLSYPRLQVLRTTDVETPPAVGRFVAAVDACDGVHVAVEFGRSGERGIALGHWQDGWSEFTRVALDGAQSPAMGTDATGAISLTVLAKPPGGGSLQNWILTYSR